MATPRPPFHVLWAAAQRIYDAKDPSGKVARTVGGKVAANINAPLHPWENTCAVRISYILNAGGVPIPHLGKKTVSGANGKWHFHLVKDVIAYLKQIWGPPDMMTAYPPPGGGPLAGKRGAILFEVQGWNNARGHASLWNGKACYDHCYFNEPNSTYTCTNANFWELP
jgi:hypothetical protein